MARVGSGSARKASSAAASTIGTSRRPGPSSSTGACSLAPRPFTIGIDGRELQGRPTGTGRYLRNLLRAWAGGPDRLVVYCAGRVPDDPTLAMPGLEARALGSGSERGAWWAERHLAPAADGDDVDVLFGPAYVCPLTTDRPRV